MWAAEHPAVISQQRKTFTAKENTIIRVLMFMFQRHQDIIDPQTILISPSALRSCNFVINFNLRERRDVLRVVSSAHKKKCSN